MTRRKIRLSDLLDRTVEEGDCLLWTGYMNRGIIPTVSVDGRPKSVRRLIHEIKTGPIPAGLQFGVNCGNWRCVRCDHIAARTCSEATKGAVRSPAARMKAALSRRKVSRISDADIAAIRASGERAAVVARRYEISDSYVSAIRKHKARKDFAHPFAGLGAR